MNKAINKNAFEYSVRKYLCNLVFTRPPLASDLLPYYYILNDLPGTKNYILEQKH